MTPDVASLASDLSLGIAARELERTGATGAPVVDDGRVVGVVALSDLFSALPEPRSRPETTGPFHRMEHLLSRISAEKGLVVQDVMTRTVATVRRDTPITEAAAIMIRRGVNRLPVVDDSGSLCGILARQDIVAAVARLAAANAAEDTPVRASQQRSRIPPD